MDGLFGWMIDIADEGNLFPPLSECVFYCSVEAHEQVFLKSLPAEGPYGLLRRLSKPLWVSYDLYRISELPRLLNEATTLKDHIVLSTEGRPSNHNETIATLESLTSAIEKAISLEKHLAFTAD